MTSYNEIIKISIVGDAGNGKTSLMKRFINNTFTNKEQSTMGIDCAFKIITVDIKNKIIKENNNDKNNDNDSKSSESFDKDICSKKIKIKVWDTAGQEKFAEIIRSCYRDSDGVIITYDTTNYQSFLNLEKWIEKVNKIINPENIVIMIVGTKTDLVDQREVSEHKIFDFIHNNKLKYIEVSSKISKNVDLLFEMMTKTILEKGKYKIKDNWNIQKINFKDIHKKMKIENSVWCGLF